MPNVIEIGAEIQINDARLFFDDRSGYTGYGFMRRPLRSAFALTYRLLLRSCKLMGAFVISPLPPFC